jgi:methylglutaconyl-CoA hydratase
MGERMAHRYFLTGERFSAAEAYRIGLLSELCLPDELDNKINELLGHIVLGGKAALAEIKDLIRAVSRGPIDDPMINDTARRIAEIRVSKEGREGIASFLGKRKPSWAAGPEDKAAPKSSARKPAKTLAKRK